MFLLAAITGRSGYIYLVSSEGIEFHGTLVEGYPDPDLLKLGGFGDPEMFRTLCRKPGKIFLPYETRARLEPGEEFGSRALGPMGGSKAWRKALAFETLGLGPGLGKGSLALLVGRAGAQGL